MCGIASRRKAEQLVRDHKIRLNGRIVTDLATRVDPGRDTVLVDGRPARTATRSLYLVMNKPKDSITTLSDERGRTTVMDFVRAPQRVYPVGRLDRNTTGVLLFTNDGEFAHRLMHPKFRIPKCYHVTCDRPVKQEHLETLRRGVRLAEGVTAASEVFVLRGGKGKEIGIVVHEGRNRQVRRMFESLGYEPLKLDRVAYGPVTKEGLSRGEVRSLTHAEIRKLKALAGIPAPDRSLSPEN